MHKDGYTELSINSKLQVQHACNGNFRVFLFWSVVFFLTRVFFLYYPYHGEPDVYQMSMGIYYNILNGNGLSGSFLYGKSFSYGYYFIIFKAVSLFPFFLNNLELLMMIITFLSSFLFIFCIVDLFSDLSPSKLNLNVFLTLLILSPVCWECTTYSHPVIPAISLSLGAAVCLKRACNNALWKKSLIYFILSSLLFFISFSFRAEVMLIVPALFLLCVGFKNKSRLLLSVASILSAVIVFFVIQRYLVHSGNISDGDAQSRETSPFDLLLNFFRQFASKEQIPKGFVAVVFSFGIISFLWIPIGFYYIVKNHYRKHLMIAILLIVPSLLFWLPNPTPFRHFLIVVIGLAFISSFCFSFFKRNVAILLLIMTVTGNMLLPEFIHGLVLKSYNFEYTNLSQLAGRIPGQIPVGCPLLNHAANRKVLEYSEKEFAYISKINEKNIIFTGFNYMVLMSDFVKNCKSRNVTISAKGILKLTIDDRKLYFITASSDQSSTDFFEFTKQMIGDEYNDNYAWYINPIMQSRVILLSGIPGNLRLIKTFSEHECL